MKNGGHFTKYFAPYSTFGTWRLCSLRLATVHFSINFVGFKIYFISSLHLFAKVYNRFRLKVYAFLDELRKGERIFISDEFLMYEVKFKSFKIFILAKQLDGLMCKFEYYYAMASPLLMLSKCSLALMRNVAIELVRISVLFMVIFNAISLPDT